MRTLDASFRDNLEATAADDVLVIFATIEHPALSVPIRVNTDIADYVYGGNTFIGAAFHLSFLSDDDSLPQAKISIQNVDRAIGEAVLSIFDAPKMKIELLVKSDFDNASPRQPLSPAPVPQYVASNLYLRNVQCDAMTVSADVVGFDLSTEPWPKNRTTPEFTPSLFR